MTVHDGLQTFEFQERFELPRPLNFATHDDALAWLKRVTREDQNLTRRLRGYLSRYCEDGDISRMSDHQAVERVAALLYSRRIVVIARKTWTSGGAPPRIEEEVGPPFPFAERKARQAPAKARAVSRRMPVLASLWVRLNLPQEQAAKETGSLRLFGSGYDSTIAIAANFIANPDPADTVDVHFESVPTGASYSLTYIAGNGTQIMIVENAPFSTLKDESLPSATKEK